MAGAICGPQKLVVDVFAPIVRTAGMTLSPFNAWVVLKGLETLSIRMQAQSANALDIARFLESHPAVGRVFYPAWSRTTARWRCGSSPAWAARCCPSTCAAATPRRCAATPSR